MGFLNGLGRFLQGKEVFEDTSKPAAVPADPLSNGQGGQSPFVDEHGYKVIPHITLDHVKAHRNGDTMLVTAWITNDSPRPVRIDECRVLGQKQVFQHELSPSKGHDFTIYNGPVAPNEYDSHAELTFRIVENGDLFKNVYHAEFNRESDGKFTLEELHDDGPVHDV